MPQIREQIAMVHLPPSKTLKYLFHVRKTTPRWACRAPRGFLSNKRPAPRRFLSHLSKNTDMSKDISVFYSVGIQCQRAVREGKYTSGIIVAQSGEDPRS